MTMPNGISENGVLAADLDTEVGKQVMQYQVCGHVLCPGSGLVLRVVWPQGERHKVGGLWAGPSGTALRTFQRAQEQYRCLWGRPPRLAPPSVQSLCPPPGPERGCHR